MTPHQALHLCRTLIASLLLLILASVPAQVRGDDVPSSGDNGASAPADDQPFELQPVGEEGERTVRLALPRLDGTGRVPGQMVEFSLTDQLGRPVTRETLLGRPWVANFIFASCPTHCPATLRELYDLQNRLRDTDVRLVTFTVDPATDTVERMLELSKAFSADPDRWLFLTGDATEIHNVITHGFHQPMSSNPMMLAHSLNLMHVDATGKIVGQYRYHFQEPEGPDQLNRLRQVLLGQIETPKENEFLMTNLADVVEQAQQQAEAADPAGTANAEQERVAPNWVTRLRTTNAMLNGLATVLLMLGFIAIKQKNVALHKRMMLLAFFVSAVFLATYLTCHAGMQYYTGKGHKPYSGDPSLLIPYRIVLWTHIALAATVPVLAIITIRRGLKQQWESHRRIAKITFPIWLYVSITGVVVYWMNM